jgi:PKD repeat protein
VTHRYGAPGRYVATLTVADDSGTSCGTVPDAAGVVVNARPVAAAGPDQRAFLGGAYDAVRFDATASSDADGDPLTYRWDFGDGTTGAGPRASHVYTRAGRYVVRLTVRDGSGLPCGEAQDELVVEVRARP